MGALGSCAATATPMISLSLQGSAVLGAPSGDFSSAQAPGTMLSGSALMKPGTNPSVFWASARAAAASGKTLVSACDVPPSASASAVAERVVTNVCLSGCVFMTVSYGFGEAVLVTST